MFTRHDTLSNFYEVNFALVQHHKWGHNDIMDMMPWERGLFVDLLQKYMKEQEMLAKDQATLMRMKKR